MICKFISWEIAIVKKHIKLIIKDLIAKLYEWTEQRWVINVSAKQGEDTILEKQKQKQDDIIDELSNTEEMKKVLEAFPESRITSVNKIEN